MSISSGYNNVEYDFSFCFTKYRLNQAPGGNQIDGWPRTASFFKIK